MADGRQQLREHLVLLYDELAAADKFSPERLLHLVRTRSPLMNDHAVPDLFSHLAQVLQARADALLAHAAVLHERRNVMVLPQPAAPIPAVEPDPVSTDEPAAPDASALRWKFPQ